MQRLEKSHDASRPKHSHFLILSQNVSLSCPCPASNPAPSAPLASLLFEVIGQMMMKLQFSWVLYLLYALQYHSPEIPRGTQGQSQFMGCFMFLASPAKPHFKLKPHKWLTRCLCLQHQIQCFVNVFHFVKHKQKASCSLQPSLNCFFLSFEWLNHGSQSLIFSHFVE